ncbi:caspase family protein [Desulfobacterales bacterium HSG2]|nr:caspase family protein [Desulfobacterales bacterium HSG2]
MKKRIIVLTSLVMLAVLLIPPCFGDSDRGIRRRTDSEEESRLALVIGNADYRKSPLRNPANDARDIAGVLRTLGFRVVHKENADKREMEESVREFGRSLRKGGVGLFYFAGHGLQMNGRNYLLPIAAKIDKETDVEYEAVDAGRVLSEMEYAENRLNIVILDACRNNPFSRNFRSFRSGRNLGLARMKAPSGTLIAYATAPGSVADDGYGRNGIYTEHLIKYINIPGLTIEEALKKVRVDVQRMTGEKQTPWEASSLTGNFYFKPETAAFLSVDSNVTGAKVTLDNVYLGETPLSEVSVSSGTHRIEVEKRGYRRYGKEIRLKVGKSLALHVDLDEKRAAPEKKGRLFVDTDPRDAVIRFLNTDLGFYQGMELKPGRYLLEISAEGRRSRKEWAEITGVGDNILDIRLEPAEIVRRKGRLFITTDPADATVRFVNIKSAFRQGMELEPGRYLMEISARGYEPRQEWTEITRARDRTLDIRLEREPKKIARLRPEPEKIVSPKPEPIPSDGGPPYKLAIFPWVLRQDATSYLNRTESIITRIISGESLFVLKHSVIDKQDIGNAIDSRIISSADVKKIWKKKHFFSSLRPDVESVCDIGKKLGVDAVLMGDFSVVEANGGLGHEVNTIRLFLIDISTRKIFSIANSSAISIYMGDFDNAIDTLVREILKKYKS